MDNMDMAMTMCPDCHEVKMGPMGMKMKMMRCDDCGKPMHEMMMKK